LPQKTRETPGEQGPVKGTEHNQRRTTLRREKTIHRELGKKRTIRIEAQGGTSTLHGNNWGRNTPFASSGKDEYAGGGSVGNIHAGFGTQQKHTHWGRQPLTGAKKRGRKPKVGVAVSKKQKKKRSGKPRHRTTNRIPIKIATFHGNEGEIKRGGGKSRTSEKGLVPRGVHYGGVLLQRKKEV